MRRSIIIGAFIGLGLMVATPASANPDTIRVQVTEADLQTRESVARLYQRVNDAAATVCVEIMRGPGAPYRSKRQCRLDLVDHALQDTRFVSLQHYHAEVRSRGGATTLASR